MTYKINAYHHNDQMIKMAWAHTKTIHKKTEGKEVKMERFAGIKNY
jgi:hypothetical protein